MKPEGRRSRRRETPSRKRVGERFRALSRALRAGVVVLFEGRIAFVNRRAMDLFGLSRRADFLRHWRDERIGERLLDEGLFEGGVVAPRDGVSADVIPLDPARTLVLLRDRSILDALEADARQAARAETLARIQRGLTHDLKGSISGMAINLDLLSESLSSKERPPAAARQRRYVAALREEVTRINRSLLEIFSQLTPLGAEQEAFDLRSPLEDVASLLAAQARKQRVRLTRRFPRDPVGFVGHRDELKKAFLNVSVNALEAMPEGGHLALEMAVDHEYARVEVRDTGKGIPAAELERVYDVHFTTKHTGCGTGLSIARALVQLHGGDMEITSAEGRGSAVRMGLPVVPRH
jgi:signal transduction histidine kinase